MIVTVRDQQCRVRVRLARRDREGNGGCRGLEGLRRGYNPIVRLSTGFAAGAGLWCTGLPVSSR